MSTSRFSYTQIIASLFLLFTLGLGLFLRLYDLSDPPLDFHPTRQLFGAMRARAIFFQTAPNIPDWQRQVSLRQFNSEVQLEPLVMENIVAFFYQYTGENVAVPRAVSGLFWLVGGIFLFFLAKNLTGSPAAALFSLCFYLFLPYAVAASRSFQPDPLMVMLLLGFWWSMETWSRSSSLSNWFWTFVAALFGGLAIYVKLTAVFFVVGGALGLLVAYGGFRSALRRPQTWVLAVLGAIPGAAYLYHGLVVKKFLANEFGGRFFPEHWFTVGYYLRWLDKLDNLFHPIWLVLVFISILLFSRRKVRTFLLTLWLFYLAFGLAQTHHIASHDYYSLPLIPVAALSLAPLSHALYAELSRRASQRWLYAFFIAALLLTSLSNYFLLRDSDSRSRAAMYAQIGEILQRQPGVIALTEDYGYPLEYYGWQNVSLWPLANRAGDFDAIFQRQTREKAYFLVTDLAELDRQPQLSAKLDTYAVFSRGTGYIIYALKQPLP